jgi:hypothetical protein
VSVGSAAEPAEPGRPNVLIILTDDNGWIFSPRGVNQPNNAENHEITADQAPSRIP